MGLAFKAMDENKIGKTIDATDVIVNVVKGLNDQLKVQQRNYIALGVRFACAQLHMKMQENQLKAIRG